MVVNDLDILSTVVPTEHNPPLAIDANGAESAQIASQRLKPIARRHTQIAQPGRRVKLLQFPHRNIVQLGRKPSRDGRHATQIQIAGQLSLEGDYHIIVS